MTVFVKLTIFVSGDTELPRRLRKRIPLLQVEIHAMPIRNGYTKPKAPVAFRYLWPGGGNGDVRLRVSLDVQRSRPQRLSRPSPIGARSLYSRLPAFGLVVFCGLRVARERMDPTEKEINQQLAVEIVRLAMGAVELAASGKMAESGTAIALLEEAVDRLALCGVASRSAMLHRLQSPSGFPTNRGPR